MNKKSTLKRINKLLDAYRVGELGDTTMPEDTHPVLNSTEEKLLYYTLPMALNYQRNSFKLWEAAQKTWEDDSTKEIFHLEYVANSETEELQKKLLKHKLGLQPNKHTNTWFRISKSIFENWGNITNLLHKSECDYLLLRETIQSEYKSSFPYLSGPKIFNYWSYILQEYCDIPISNREYIEIAPDTHVIQASIKLGIIEEGSVGKLSRQEISQIWRDLLKDTRISPIDVHSPLWFWSRSGFKKEI